MRGEGKNMFIGIRYHLRKLQKLSNDLATIKISSVLTSTYTSASTSASLYICISIYLHLYISASLYICISIYLHLYISASLSLYISCIYLYLCIYPVYISISISISGSIYPVYISISISELLLYHTSTCSYSAENNLIFTYFDHSDFLLHGKWKHNILGST